jgi:archaellum component FlaC
VFLVTYSTREAEMPEVKVIDLAHVNVDGVVAGSVVDVLDNYRPIEGIKDLLFAAVQRWSDDREQAHETAVASLRECHCKECDDLKATHATALQDTYGKHRAELDEAAQAHASNLQAATDSHAKAMASLKEQLQADRRAETDELQAQITELHKVIDEQKAVTGKHQTALDEAAQAHTEAIQAIADSHSVALATLKEQLQADHRAETDGLRSQIAELLKVIDEQKTLIETLGGTELGQQMAREKRCRELRETIARLQAEHDAMAEPQGA